MLNFYLPEFLSTFKFNKIFIEFFNKYSYYFYDDINIAGFYGTFPTCLWSGGRYIKGYKLRKEEISEIASFYNNYNIPLILTFTNTLLKEQHLNDPYCNLILTLLENDLNEITIVSDILEHHIRQNYTKYKINSSTCKHILDIDTFNTELQRYNRAILNYNFNNNIEILKRVKYKSKCEILVNPWCKPNCINRQKHYDQLSEIYLHINNHKVTNQGLTLYCSDIVTHQNVFYNILKYKTVIDVGDVYDIYYKELGFSHFKIEGRSLHYMNIIEAILYYTVKKEYIDMVRLELLLLCHKPSMV